MHTVVHDRHKTNDFPRAIFSSPGTYPYQTKPKLTISRDPKTPSLHTTRRLCRNTQDVDHQHLSSRDAAG